MWQAGRLRIALYYILYALCFILPFSYQYTSLCIVVLTAVWLLNGEFSLIKKRIKNRKIFWAFLLYFGLFAFSYTYSDNTEQSLFDTQSKISLLLLPFIIGLGLPINKKRLEHILLSFVCGVTAVAIYSIAYGTFNWVTTGDITYMFYHKLVEQQDPNAVYEALYSLFSISVLLLFKWKQHFTGNRFKLKVAITIIQILFFTLLASKTLIVLFILCVVPFYIRFILRNELNPKRIGLAVSVLVVGLCLLTFTDNPVRDRYEDIMNKDLSIVTLEDYSNVKESDFSNFTLRLFLWRLCFDNVSDHNLWVQGAGNGDAQALQNEKLKEIGIRNIHPQLAHRSPFYNTNVHNMYFQSLLMVGIGGMILLIIITLSPFTKFYSLLDEPYILAFHISILFFMFQEAMLQTQAGTAYYALIYSIYISAFHEKDTMQ